MLEDNILNITLLIKRSFQNKKRARERISWTTRSHQLGEEKPRIKVQRRGTGKAGKQQSLLGYQILDT
jgi:hypothetical protein